MSPYRRARPPESNFEDLLRPQVEYLYRLAWRFTGSVADAEDLVQDVLIKLFPRTQELLEIERLLEDLVGKGFCNAYAGITMPNEGSIALHRSLGFESIGVFKAVGRKFGRWHDVAWFQRSLRSSPPQE